MTRPSLRCTITREPALVRGARALRHRVFVAERGAAEGSQQGLEGGPADDGCDHAVVHDPEDPAAGPIATARFHLGSCWTGREFDLSVLHARGIRLAEIGRTCVHPDHRDGIAAMVLFAGVVGALRGMGADAIVGAASFHGRDPTAHMDALRALRAAALAPPEWRPVPRGPGAVRVEGHAPRLAMAGVPPLIKAYLRAGAWVGEGACVDAAFNVVDVCVVLDMARLHLPRGMEGARE